MTVFWVFGIWLTVVISWVPWLFFYTRPKRLLEGLPPWWMIAWACVIFAAVAPFVWTFRTLGEMLFGRRFFEEPK